MNNAVQISTQLTATVLSNPPIGGQNNVGLAFTAGDSAVDEYKNITTSPVALNADIGGAGFLQVVNPALVEGVANTKSVNILCATQAMGPIPPGASALLPLASGTVYNATVASDTLTVGVTVIECDLNS